MRRFLAFIFLLSMPVLSHAEEVYCYDETVDFFVCVKKTEQYIEKRDFGVVSQILDSLDEKTATRVVYGAGLFHSDSYKLVNNGELDQSNIKKVQDFIFDLKNIQQSSNLMKSLFKEEIEKHITELELRSIIQIGSITEVREALRKYSEIDYKKEISSIAVDLGRRAVSQRDPELLSLFITKGGVEDLEYGLIYDYLNYGDYEAILFLKNNGVDITQGCRRCGGSVLCDYLSEVTETAEEPLSKTEIDDYIDLIESLTSSNQRESIKCSGDSLSEVLSGFNKMHLERLEEFETLYTPKEPVAQRKVKLEDSDSIIVKKDGRHLIINRQYSKECSKSVAKSYFDSWAYNYSLRVFNRDNLKEGQNFFYVEQKGSCLLKIHIQPLLTPFVGEPAVELKEFWERGWPL